MRSWPTLHNNDVKEDQHDILDITIDYIITFKMIFKNNTHFFVLFLS